MQRIIAQYSRYNIIAMQWRNSTMGNYLQFTTFKQNRNLKIIKEPRNLKIKNLKIKNLKIKNLKIKNLKIKNLKIKNLKI